MLKRKSYGIPYLKTLIEKPVSLADFNEVLVHIKINLGSFGNKTYLKKNKIKMSKYLVEYKIDTPVSSETFLMKLSAPNTDGITEFIVSLIGPQRINYSVYLIGITELTEEECKKLDDKDFVVKDMIG